MTSATRLRSFIPLSRVASPGGALVVHDCLPPDAAVTSPTFVAGPWWGVTYKTYLDFLGARNELDYYTIDADCGCGVIRKFGRRSRWWRRHGSRIGRPWRHWRNAVNDFDSAFAVFERHKDALLRLTHVDRFAVRLATSPTSRALPRCR